MSLANQNHAKTEWQRNPNSADRETRKKESRDDIFF
jgi:hypothetical protein